MNLMQWVTDTLQSSSLEPTALPLAFLPGLVSAAASTCCTLPALGMLLAYSGTREAVNHRAAFASTLSFMAGTTLALMVPGFVAGFAGQAAQALPGKYWKLFAGVLAVVLGLAALKLLPVKLPGLRRTTVSRPAGPGILGAMGAGLLMGGGVAAASLPCNPGIYIVIGGSILMGHIRWGLGLMAAFGLGFSLPLGAILSGVAAGKTAIKTQRAEAAIRGVAGVLLVGAGFHLLATF